MASMRRLSALSVLTRDAARGVRVSRPPTGPSCSRWLSCSCCVRNRQPSRPPGPPAQDGPSHGASYPSVSSFQHMTTPHLPLPPSLPWSPNSHQFLRHLQILSLSLLGQDTDESWRIYEALFPDLRPVIPDDVFVSLIAHQASGSSPERRTRLLDLVNVARACEMDPRRLSTDTLMSTLETIVHAPPHDDSWTPEAYESLDWTWDSLVSRGQGMLGKAPLQLRQDWLEVMSFRHRDDLKSAQAALENLVENGGGNDITTIAGRILLAQSKILDYDGLCESLRLMAWCVARDVVVQDKTINVLLSRMRLRAGLGKTRAAMEDLIRQLEQGGAVQPALQFQQALNHFITLNRSRRENAEGLLHNVNVTSSKLRKAVYKLLDQKRRPAKADLELAVKLCNRTLQVNDEEYDRVLHIVLYHVWTCQRFDLAVELGRAALQAGVFRREPVSEWSKCTLLESAITALPSPEAYRVAQRVYPYVRTWTHTWNKPGMPKLWRRLFESAINNRHIWFASRLYADFQADGLVVPRASMLGMVNLVSSRPSQSRNILLERHIKDYVYHDEHPTEALIVAFTRGLVLTGARDAEMAVFIARRVDLSLPVQAVELVVAPLCKSHELSHRQLALGLLRDLPAADAASSYEAAIAALVKNTSSAVGLTEILAIYKEMLSREVPITVRVASAIIVALLKGGELDSALSVFNVAIESSLAIRSGVMGRLMVNLAVAGRCDEAYAAETRWRGMFPNGVDYDKGVRGARLLVDLKAGRDVDLSAFTDAEGRKVESEDGYTPSRPYLLFLENVQRELDGLDEVEMGAEVVAEHSEREEAVGNSSGKAAANEPEQPSWMTDPGRGGDGGSPGGGVQMGSLRGDGITILA